MIGEVFPLKEGDNRPRFVVVLKDNYGEINEAVVSIPVGTTAAFFMRTAATNAMKIDGVAATITDFPGGEVEYEWQAGDSDTPAGDMETAGYEVEIRLTYPDGGIETFPNNDYFGVSVFESIPTTD